MSPDILFEDAIEKAWSTPSAGESPATAAARVAAEWIARMHETKAARLEKDSDAGRYVDVGLLRGLAAVYRQAAADVREAGGIEDGYDAMTGRWSS